MNLQRLIAVPFLCLLLCLAARAQKVSYLYRPLTMAGCKMTYRVSNIDTIYFVEATVRSKNLNFEDKPVMKLTTFQGHELEIKGNVLRHSTETFSYYNSFLIGRSTDIVSTARFRLTPRQFELLNEGISHISLSITPYKHERKFRKDKIGKKLYQFYLQEKKAKSSSSPSMQN